MAASKELLLLAAKPLALVLPLLTTASHEIMCFEEWEHRALLAPVRALLLVRQE